MPISCKSSSQFLNRILPFLPTSYGIEHWTSVCSAWVHLQSLAEKLSEIFVPRHCALPRVSHWEPHKRLTFICYHSHTVTHPGSWWESRSYMNIPYCILLLSYHSCAVPRFGATCHLYRQHLLLVGGVTAGESPGKDVYCKICEAFFPFRRMLKCWNGNVMVLLWLIITHRAGVGESAKSWRGLSREIAAHAQ